MARKEKKEKLRILVPGSKPSCMPRRYTALHILLSSGGRLLFWVRIRRERLPLSFFGRDLKGMGGERLVYSSSLRFSSLTRSHWPNMGCPWKALPLERHSGMINKFNIPLFLFWSWDSKRMGGKGLFLIPSSPPSSLSSQMKSLAAEKQIQSSSVFWSECKEPSN